MNISPIAWLYPTQPTPPKPASGPFDAEAHLTPAQKLAQREQRIQGEDNLTLIKSASNPVKGYLDIIG